MFSIVRLLLAWKIEELKLNDHWTKKNNDYEQDSTDQRKTAKL